jgi:hypothetical protein
LSVAARLTLLRVSMLLLLLVRCMGGMSWMRSTVACGWGDWALRPASQGACACCSICSCPS